MRTSSPPYSSRLLLGATGRLLQDQLCKNPEYPAVLSLGGPLAFQGFFQFHIFGIKTGSMEGMGSLHFAVLSGSELEPLLSVLYPPTPDFLDTPFSFLLRFTHPLGPWFVPNSPYQARR
jgi:hypothetical protein